MPLCEDCRKKGAHKSLEDGREPPPGYIIDQMHRCDRCGRSIWGRPNVDDETSR